jgi:hypothetical protein
MTATVVATSTAVNTLSDDNCRRLSQDRRVAFTPHRPRYDYTTLSGRLSKVVEDFEDEGVPQGALSSWIGFHRSELTTMLKRLRDGGSVTVDKWTQIASKLNLSLDWWIYGHPPEGYSAAAQAGEILVWWKEQLERAKRPKSGELPAPQVAQVAQGASPTRTRTLEDSQEMEISGPRSTTRPPSRSV